MHSTLVSYAIATRGLDSHLESVKIHTPQRRARYHDKTRIRFADIKRIALRDCKCSDTAEMKRRLKILGIKLDLRLTSAWIAIVWELQNLIEAIPQVKRPIPTPKLLLDQALTSGAIASWKEDDDGGLYWIQRTLESERELVTTSGLGMFLRSQAC